MQAEVREARFGSQLSHSMLWASGITQVFVTCKIRSIIVPASLVVLCGLNELIHIKKALSSRHARECALIDYCYLFFLFVCFLASKDWAGVVQLLLRQNSLCKRNETNYK